MKIIVGIGGDSAVGMEQAQLDQLNELLKDCPVANRYSDDKIDENARIKLSAKLVIKTTSYKIDPSIT